MGKTFVNSLPRVECSGTKGNNHENIGPTHDKIAIEPRDDTRYFDSNWKHIRRGRHRMVVGFTTTCAISAYHH